MRRVGRWIFNSAAAISLVLFIANAALWAHGTGEEDFITLETGSGRGGALGGVGVERGIVCCDGEIGVGMVELKNAFGPGDGSNVTRRWRLSWKENEKATLLYCVYPHAALGFEWMHYGEPAGFANITGNVVAIPNWALAVLTSVLPLVVYARLLKRARGESRRSSGLCPKCGYDLRATPDRCPECGTVVEKLAEAK